MKAFLKFTGIFLATFLVASSALAFDLISRRDVALPRTLFADVSLGGLTREEVRALIKEKITAFLEEPIQLGARGKVAEVTLKELGVTLNESILLNAVPFASDYSAPELVLFSIAGHRVTPPITVERTELLRVIDKKFPDIPRAKNAHVVRTKKGLEIEEGTAGVTPVLEPLIEEMKQSLIFLSHRSFVVEFREAQPSVLAADLEAHREAVIAALPSKLILTHEEEKYAVDFEEHPQWLVFEKKPYEVSGDELPFTMQWDELAFSQFLSEKIAGKLEQAPEDVKISRGEDSKVVFEGRGNEGKAIPRGRLLVFANQAIANHEESVEIPLEVVPPKVEISEDLQILGVQGLIGVGHTKFAGSPVNRKHNIGVGIAKFSGLLVPPGETFSFNDNLGPVDDTTGFKKELVIKPEGTIPEFGGGLCQVSTTLYRAALYTGLPVVERAPHSYVVTYYSQIGGHGIDATIYPPSRDLKFLNDTPGHILIQSYVDGVDAFFKFYGTSDGREVRLEGPFISNRKNAPAEPVLVPDPTLPAGEKKQVEKPHAGFDTLWYRYVTKNGEEIKESIVSKYKAVPAKFLVGGEVSPEGENKGLVEGNPFE